MANWTNIPTDRIEPGKPIRAIDGLALRDNPIAIAEGASGAPKISEQAFNTNSINGDRIRNRSVDQSKLAENNGTRDWVGRRNAALGAGAVGTYAWVQPTYTSGLPIRIYSWNQTVSGGNLCRGNQSPRTGGQFSGTWRILAQTISSGEPGVGAAAGLAIRIS